MVINSWIEIIGIILGGGALGVLLSFILNVRKQNQSEFIVLLQKYKELVEEGKTEFKEYMDSTKSQLIKHSIEISELQKLLHKRDKEIIQLRNQLMIFESSHADVPVPIWLKDASGVMLFVNKEYNEKILQPVNRCEQDYIGKKDIEFWGKEVGTEYRKHDRKVIQTEKAEKFIESWPGQDGEDREGRVIKYPRWDSSRRTIIGIGGMIIDSWKKGSK